MFNFPNFSDIFYLDYLNVTNTLIIIYLPLNFEEFPSVIIKGYPSHHKSTCEVHCRKHRPQDLKMVLYLPGHSSLKPGHLLSNMSWWVPDTYRTTRFKGCPQYTWYRSHPSYQLGFRIIIQKVTCWIENLLLFIIWLKSHRFRDLPEPFSFWILLKWIFTKLTNWIYILECTFVNQAFWIRTWYANTTWYEHVAN